MDAKLKVFYVTFRGKYAVGAGRFLCVAPDKNAAEKMLYKEMLDANLMSQFSDAVDRLKEIKTNHFAKVIDFRDGDY